MHSSTSYSLVQGTHVVEDIPKSTTMSPENCVNSKNCCVVILAQST